MRFMGIQDETLLLNFNKELLYNWVDIEVVLYKLHIYESKSNVYGESENKRYYNGVQLQVLVDRSLSTPTKDVQTINIEQTSEFYFLRQTCIDANIYPERGDIIYFDSLYYEIDNINETQLVAGQPAYNWAILTSAHLTRLTGVQLESPVV